MARTRQQQETSQTQSFQHDNQNQSFQNGVMHVAGRPQQPVEVQHWLSSNGTTQYTCVKWRDAVTGEVRTSCNCPGWAIMRGTVRRCCHTDDMEGVKTCKKEKVGKLDLIRSVQQAVDAIPEISEGKELRGFIFDD